MVWPSQDSNVSENKNRQRDLDENDDRRTPAAEKQQDHQADQRGGEHGLANDPEDRGLDEDRLIADGVQTEARRQNFIRPQLSTVGGAAVPSPYGGKILQVQVDLDQHAMQAHRGRAAVRHRGINGLKPRRARDARAPPC